MEQCGKILANVPLYLLHVRDVKLQLTN